MADVRSVWLCLLFTLPTYAQPPVLKQGGVVNAASFAEAVSPGSLVSIFGENMSTHALAAISMPLPTSLGGVKVYLSNTPAPLIFVSSGQINAQVPWEVAGAEALDVTVWTNDISSNTITVPFANAAPGIFTSSGPGYDLGEVTIGNTDVVAGPRRVRPFYARPVKRGEYLVVYATGLGAVSHTPETGHMTKGNPVAITTTPVTVSFGDRTLVPTFAGLTPGFVGLWQVNVRVPDDMPAGSKVPLAITVDGVTSNTVMIAVSDEPVWQIGNGGITGVRFTDRTPAVSRPIIDKLVWQAVPIMDRIFGPPADAIVLTVDTGCGWNYDGVTQTLCAGAPPTDPDETEGFANIFYHELAHAYTVSARWNDGQRSTPNWFLEGVADAVDELTILYLNQIGATAYRNINDLINLGLYSLGGPEIVGGSWGRAFKQTRIGSALNTYAAYELFLMLATTQSSATSGVWMNYTALADLKAELYWLSNIRQGAPTYGDFLRAVERTCRYPIDGLPAVEWVKRQPVTHTDGTPGTYLFTVPAAINSTGYVWVDAFERTNEWYAGIEGIRTERQLAQGIVTVTVEGTNGFSNRVTFDLSKKDANGRPDVMIPITPDINTPMPYGVYRVTSEADLNGVHVVSPATYAMRYRLNMVPENPVMPRRRLYIVQVRADGSIDPSPVPAIPGGRFLVNEGGGAVWEADPSAFATVPASVRLFGREISLPLTFGRTVIVTVP